MEGCMHPQGPAPSLPPGLHQSFAAHGRQECQAEWASPGCMQHGPGLCMVEPPARGWMLVVWS